MCKFHVGKIEIRCGPCILPPRPNAIRATANVRMSVGAITSSLDGPGRVARKSVLVCLGHGLPWSRSALVTVCRCLCVSFCVPLFFASVFARLSWPLGLHLAVFVPPLFWLCLGLSVVVLSFRPASSFNLLKFPTFNCYLHPSTMLHLHTLI